jgi:flagellar biosynthesis/type III secretory pathway M-ring protein FliF/YscJ
MRSIGMLGAVACVFLALVSMSRRTLTTLRSKAREHKRAAAGERVVRETLVADADEQL